MQSKIELILAIDEEMIIGTKISGISMEYYDPDGLSARIDIEVHSTHIDDDTWRLILAHTITNVGILPENIMTDNRYEISLEEYHRAIIIIDGNQIDNINIAIQLAHELELQYNNYAKGE